MRILHVSADYPDPLGPAKTRAVSNLLAMVDNHEHRVFSLNRVHWRLGIRALAFADDCGTAHRAVTYGAPSRGLLLATFLQKVADWIIADCKRAQWVPDLIHAHKLSIEGLIGRRLAAEFGVSLAVSVQGNTDLKITRVRRDLRPLYRKIWHETDVVFPFAPWAREGLDRMLGQRRGPVFMLPCPGPADDMLAPRIAPPVICTAFHMRDAANKNAAGLIRAVAQASQEIPDLQLEIIGGGDPGAFARLSTLAETLAPGKVRFLGAVAHQDIQKKFNGACAFALISHRESYGMVFAEALLAGTPCLIPRAQGIDGYFPDGSIVVAAGASDVDAIAQALVRLVRDQADFKQRLSEMGQSGGLDILRRTHILSTYQQGLARATNPG